MWTVNVKSAVYGMQAIVPHFQERGRGHVINISSFLGKVPVASVRSAYSASKAALNILTANLRMDLRATHPDVHVSLVLPGMVTTGFARNALHGTPTPPPPGTGPFRPQTAEEIAEIVVRLIDEPAPEVYTVPQHKELAVRYVSDVAAVEARLASR